MTRLPEWPWLKLNSSRSWPKQPVSLERLKGEIKDSAGDDARWVKAEEFHECFHANKCVEHLIELTYCFGSIFPVIC